MVLRSACTNVAVDMEGKKHIHIEHPEAWELLVSIDDRQVDYILYTPSVTGSLAIGQVAPADDSLQSLEDAIYDTPELLDEYKRVRVVVHSPHFVMVPMATSDDDCRLMALTAFPEDDGDVSICELPLNDVKIAFLMPRGMQAFLGRTFDNPDVCLHLKPLCEYFAELNRGNDSSRMFLHLTDMRMDMAIYQEGALVCSNSYPFDEASDATYFVLNAWRAHGMDQLIDELHLIGDSEMRAVMTPLLREYVKQVMPAVYPAAALRLGRNAMQAPLDLILLALCE